MRRDGAWLLPSSYPVQLEVATREGEMGGGHLNNVAIAGYHDRVREFVLFEHLPELTGEAGELRSVMAQVTLAYLREAAWPQPVLACTGIGRIGNSSFVFHTALFQAGQCIGVGEAVQVCLGANGSQALPADIRARLVALRLDIAVAAFQPTSA